MCHDYRILNTATITPPFLPGNLDAVVARHAGHKYICVLDLLGAFYAYELDEASKPYTAFFVPGRGFMAYNRMPMGLTGSPATEQLGMIKAFKHLLHPGPVDYWMDDMFISADTFDEGLTTLRKVLEAADRHKLRFAPTKTRLFVPSAVLGGQVVSVEGVSPDPAKVDAIVRWPKPRTAMEVLQFVNTCGFYRHMIDGFATKARPLTELFKIPDRKNPAKGAYKKALTNKDITTEWSAAHDTSFDTLKSSLATFPIIRDPIYATPPIPVHVVVDASAEGFGAELYQDRGDGDRRTIMWASRKTTDSESRHHSYLLELAAVKWALDRFSLFLHGQPIVLYSDCSAVKGLLNKANISGVQARWKQCLTIHNIMKIVHRPGTDNIVADALSRNPTDNDSAEVEPDPWQEKQLVHAVHRIDLDETMALRDRFRGDTLGPVVDHLAGFFTSDEDGVARRAARYWIEDGKLWLLSQGPRPPNRGSPSERRSRHSQGPPRRPRPHRPRPMHQGPG